jgi:predicted double-glycine peptidase
VRSRQALLATILCLTFIFGYLAVFPDSGFTGNVVLTQNTTNNSTSNNENTVIVTQQATDDNKSLKDFTIQETEYHLQGVLGTKQTVELNIISNLDRPITITLQSDDQAVIPATTEITIEHSITIPVTIMLQNKNATIHLSDGTMDVPVHFYLLAQQQLTTDKDLPIALQGSWSTTRIINAILAVALLGIVVLAILQKRLLKKSD